MNFQPHDDDEDEINGNVTHLDVGSIRSVKVSKEGRRNIPKVKDQISPFLLNWSVTREKIAGFCNQESNYTLGYNFRLSSFG